MESCDLIIVGGGPAGSSLAWKLKDLGLDVLIMDKSSFPRDKVCAGWVTPSVFKTLQIDPAEYGKNRELQPITGFRTGMIGRSEILTEYGKTVSYGIRRSEFDHYLLERSGARLRLGEPVKTIFRQDSHWIINESFKAPIVIGAGGHFCPVSRLINPDNGNNNVSAVIAKEIEFEMDEREQRECRVRPDIPELYFCDDLKGYGWCFRKGKYLNIGLGRQDKEGVSRHVESFSRLLMRQGKVSHIPAKFKGHAYMLYPPASRNLLEDGVMLIGDAAGLAHPKSGEGIRPAIESGLMAADVIVAAGGNYNKDKLRPYTELLKKRLGGFNAGNALDMFPEYLKKQISRKAMTSKFFSRHILLDRWFLNSHQAPLSGSS